jgi:serine/threonine protein kinase
VDYLLTLGHRKVKELKTKRLEFSACRIRVDGRGALLRNFEIIKCVGTGGFSRVYLCRGYGQLMALKVINKDFIVEN